MAKPKNNFQKSIRDGRRFLKKLTAEFEAMDTLVEMNRDEEAFHLTLGAYETICKLFKVGAHICTISGDPSAEMEVEVIVEQELPVQMGYAENGWFVLRMPKLSPRKNSGDNDHLRRILNPAFKRFFNSRQETQLFEKCWIIYRHVYDSSSSDSGRYDIDNFERNFVTDTIAMYVMVDDAAKYCRHICYSVPGTEDRTEVYVIPFEDIFKWLRLEDTISEEGLKITDSGVLF